MQGEYNRRGFRRIVALWDVDKVCSLLPAHGQGASMVAGTERFGQGFRRCFNGWSILAE